MPLLLPFLVLQIAGQLAIPAHPYDVACDTLAELDGRPYTLCLEEASFEQADFELNRQWAATLSHVKASKGSRGAKRLRNEQRNWIKDRNRQCERLAANSPVTQAARNELSCMAILTEKRTAQLKAMAKSN